MLTVSVLALHGVVPFDLSIPCEVFSRVRLAGGRPGYEVRVCGEAPLVKAGAFDLRVPCGLEGLAGAHTVMVPGVAHAGMPIADEVLTALRAAAAGGARIASICSGAFVLAAAGLLDGRRATTHWLAAETLARRYPAVEVDANVLFIDNGEILTSAGAAAGLDLCLHMVRRDHGALAAAEASRLAVMPLERAGGQAQFIVHAPPAGGGSLQPVLDWAMGHLHEPLGLETLARQAALSTRTLSRRFMEQVGATPLQWLLAARVRRAQELLVGTGLPVEQIATEAGFGSASSLRARFAQALGTTPNAYRRAFTASPHAAPADGAGGPPTPGTTAPPAAAPTPPVRAPGSAPRQAA